MSMAGFQGAGLQGAGVALQAFRHDLARASVCAALTRPSRRAAAAGPLASTWTTLALPTSSSGCRKCCALPKVWGPAR